MSRKVPDTNGTFNVVSSEDLSVRVVWLLPWPAASIKVNLTRLCNCQLTFFNGLSLSLWFSNTPKFFPWSVSFVDVKKVLVVTTDGFSSLGIDFTRKLANTLKKTNVKVFSVGTSDRVYKAEVDELSSEPSKTHELLKDLAKGSFTKDELEQFAKEICKNE